jgi:hypothetical protein
MALLPPGTDPTLFVTRFAVQPSWKNSGSTPTREMQIRVDFGIGLDGGLDHWGRYRFDEERFFIGPHSVAGSNFVEIQGLNELIQNGQAGIVGLDPPLMLIWGRARYEDVFGGWHWVRWCYRVRPDRHTGELLRVSFIQWTTYNQSGDGDYPGGDAEEFPNLTDFEAE